MKSLLGSVIKNYSEESVRENGYDLRLCGDRALKIKGSASLPERASDYEEVPFDEYLDMEPLTTYLIESCEEFAMPNDLAALMTLRSTFARNGFVAPPTVIDAGYTGKIVVALTSLYRARVKKGTRAMHLLFFKLDEPTEKPYHGRYKGGVKL